MSPVDSRSAVERFDACFRTIEAGMNGESRSPVHAARRAAMDRVREQGFPTLHDEEWRYTNLSSLLAADYVPAGPGDPAAARAALGTIDGLDGFDTLLVLVNGWYSPELSRLSGQAGFSVRSIADLREQDPVTLLPLIDAIDPERRTAFTELNTAFLHDGLVVTVDAGVVVEHPIAVVHVTVPGGESVFTSPRTIIRAGRGAQLTTAEYHISSSDGVYYTNAVTQLHADDSAVLRHVRVQRESELAYHTSHVFLALERASVVSTHAFLLGAALSRNDVAARLAGEGCEATLDGLYVPHGSQHVDAHTIIDHAAAHCNSHELYRGVLDDKARGVFSGRIIVRPGAQKTDAKQSNNNLLLSETAAVDTKPQLEIFADDVKCTHGATIGRLDDDALFYLRSRGIPVRQAQAILTLAFAEAVVERISDERIRASLTDVVARRVHQSSH